MVEHARCARFLLETAQPVRIGGEGRREDLDGDVASQACIPGSVDLSHAPGADQPGELVGAETEASGESHEGRDVRTHVP